MCRLTSELKIMPIYEHTVEIAAPIQDVYAFDSNPENWPRTMPSLLDLEIVEETVNGKRIRATYEMLGRSLDAEMELRVVEPNEHLVVTVEASGMRSEVHNRFLETDFATQIAHRAEYEFGDSLLDRIVEPVATRYNNRQFKAHLQNTKDLIESEAAVQEPPTV